MSAKHWHRLSHECDLWRQGLTCVAGVDEAGCGPLAGPVVAAAVVFPCGWLETGLWSKLRGLNDSKQLDEDQREKYYAILTGHPDIRYQIASVDVEMIDRINIRQAAWKAMHLALDQLDPRPQHVLVDGLRIRWLPYNHTPLIDGDARSYTIAAASVLAKVTRDRMMRELDHLYPGTASPRTKATRRRNITPPLNGSARARSTAGASPRSGRSKPSWICSLPSPGRAQRGPEPW